MNEAEKEAIELCPDDHFPHSGLCEDCKPIYDALLRYGNLRVEKAQKFIRNWPKANHDWVSNFGQIADGLESLKERSE